MDILHFLTEPIFQDRFIVVIAFLIGVVATYKFVALPERKRANEAQTKLDEFIDLYKAAIERIGKKNGSS